MDIALHNSGNTKKLIQWFGHIMRKDDTSLKKQVLKWVPPGGRKRGEPKLT